MTPTAYVDGCVCCCTLQVWASFHPGGSELPPQKKAQLARGLLQHVDKNHDGSMDFEEFAGWPVSVPLSALDIPSLSSLLSPLSST